MERKSFLYKWLMRAYAYKLVQNIFGSSEGRIKLVNEYIRPCKNCRILDIGCGSCDILQYYPQVDYTGIDYNKDYIDVPKKRFANCGSFICQSIESLDSHINGKYDIITFLGVLHHLNDDEARSVLQKAHDMLDEKGRVITLDGFLHERQNPVSRFFSLSLTGAKIPVLQKVTRNFVVPSLASHVIKPIFANCLMII